jgi:agmatine deiminase
MIFVVLLMKNTIIFIVETNPEDANYAPLQDNLKRLQNSENGKTP